MVLLIESVSAQFQPVSLHMQTTGSVPTLSLSLGLTREYFPSPHAGTSSEVFVRQLVLSKSVNYNK